MKALDVAEAYADQKIIGIVEKKAKETPPKEKKTKRKKSPVKKSANKVGASTAPSPAKVLGSKGLNV